MSLISAVVEGKSGARIIMVSRVRFFNSLRMLRPDQAGLCVRISRYASSELSHNAGRLLMCV